MSSRASLSSSTIKIRSRGFPAPFPVVSFRMTNGEVSKYEATVTGRKAAPQRRRGGPAGYTGVTPVAAPVTGLPCRLPSGLAPRPCDAARTIHRRPGPFEELPRPQAPARPRRRAAVGVPPQVRDGPRRRGPRLPASPQGERVGFLGPNGAGKTTTLKMLAGLLHPPRAACAVGGHVPQARDPRFLQLITLVMGQKQQLLWDLPPAETYAMNRAIYDVPRAQADETIRALVELLEIGDLIHKPTRQLSLGERMKCELVGGAAAPAAVLFLDEPTIGLDVSMQAKMRRLHPRLQRALRRGGAADQPLHGRRGGAVPAGDRHRPRPPASTTATCASWCGGCARTSG